MGVQFDMESAQRIAQTVLTVERQGTPPSTPGSRITPVTRFLVGKLDASWKRDAADDETEVVMSVYTPGWDDATFNISVKPGNFHGYLYQGTWCLCLDDGTAWRVIYPMGYEVLGQFNSSVTRGNKEDFSVYYWSSSGVWTDTTDDILDTDATPVYNQAGASGSTISAGKRCVAKLDPRGLTFGAAPLECE